MIHVLNIFPRRIFIIASTTLDVQNYTTAGISFRNDILRKIDSERGLISRSVYLRKILEQTYTDNEVTGINQVEGPSKDTSTCSTLLNLPATQGSEDLHG